MNRIIFITTMAGSSWGGSEELWVKMAKDTNNDGKEVFVTVFDWGLLPEKIKKLQELNINVLKRRRFQFRELHKKLWGKFIENFFAYGELEEIIKRSEANEMVVSMGGFCDLEIDLNRRFLLNSNLPYDLIIHVNPESYYPPFNKVPSIIEVCKKARTVYFVSKRLKEIAIRQTGYNFSNGRIIVNPVNIKEVGILPWIEPRVLNFACVARLEAKVKGQALLLQALSQPEWKKRKWHLNFYGKGPDEEFLRHLVKSFSLDSQVTFHGYVDDVRNDIWKKNHLLVLPSYYEGLPIALVEAMLCGRSAVVTNVGGNTEILKDEETGFVADGTHMNSLRNALNRAWERKEQLQIIGENAYSDIEKYTSPTKYY